jgi:hypothetical protein
MKVYDIISEEREQLNEFLPLIAGIGIGGILTAISVGISAWNAYDIYKFVKKYNEDPKKITDDEWIELFIDSALLFTPALSKLGRSAITSVLPKSWLAKGGQWFRGKMLKLYAKSSTKGLTGTARIKALRQLANGTKFAALADQRVRQLGTAWKIIQLAGAGAVGYDYWKKFSVLDDQYSKFKAGDKTTAVFGDSSDSDGYEIYKEVHAQLMGELTVAIGGIVGGMAVGKVVGFLGSFVGKAPVLGPLLGGSIQIVAGLTRMLGNTSVYIPLFMATDAGKKFMRDGFISAITKGIGRMEQGSIDMLAKALEEIGVSKSITDKIPGKTADAPSSVKANDAETDKYIKTGQGDPAFRKQTVGKKIYIGGVQVTDDDGYQLPNFENYFKDLQDKAKIAGEPDPTAGIPKKPGVDYNTGF